MNKVIKTAVAAILALSVTIPAFAAPDDNNGNTGESYGRFTDIGEENFAWAKQELSTVMRTELSDLIMM